MVDSCVKILHGLYLNSKISGCFLTIFLTAQRSECFGLIFCLFLHQEDYWTDQNKIFPVLIHTAIPSTGVILVPDLWAASSRGENLISP